MRVVRGAWAALIVVAVVQLGGCPTSPSTEFVAGGTGAATVLRSQASVDVLTPASDLTIVGGTPVEVDWRAFATTRTSVLNVIIDPDQTPDNGNEISAYTNLPLTQTTALLDTTSLQTGTYSVGVVLTDAGNIVAFGYAPGQLILNQRPTLTFIDPTDSSSLSVRQNVVLDRSSRVDPRFTVAWTLNDPDATDTVSIFLSPGGGSGNDILLFTSHSQIGDSFSFQLPTSVFGVGTYKIIAVVSNGQNSTSFTAPGSIRLRARLAGYVDLRNIDLADSLIAGAVFEGFNPRDNAGSFVASAGDLDGDGFTDFLILSQFAKPRYNVNTERTGVGEAYLVYGRRERFSGRMSLNSVGTLVRGEVFLGAAEQADPTRPSRGITSFTTLGDWDGDGVREFAFGLPFTDSLFDSPIVALDNDGAFRSGGVVIAAGSSLRPSAGFPGGNIYRLDEFGQRAHTGPPVAMACPMGFFGPNSPGFGGPSPTGFYRYLVNFPLGVEPARLGCRVHTNDVGDQCGETISAYPGNGILISVPNRDPQVNTRIGRSIPGAGVVSLYFGSFAWDDTDVFLPHSGPYRYILDDQRRFEANVGGVLFLPASPGYYYDFDNAVPCTLSFRHPCEIDGQTCTVPQPTSTLRVYGGFPGASIGEAVAASDFNADGLTDFLVGSPLSNDGAGSCFIVLGRLPGLMTNAELAIEELGLPMDSSNPLGQRILDGVRIIGAPGDRLGQAQSSAGDFNNDGIADVLIGSPLVNNRQGGAAVFFGSRTVINLTDQEIPFDELPSRRLGVIFVGEGPNDLAGARVASAGDVDGDGNDDILIAAPNRSVRLDTDGDGILDIDRTECGVVYLIYGSPDLINHQSRLDDGTLTEPGRLLLRDVGTDALPGVVFIGRNSGDQLGAGLSEHGDMSHGIARAGDLDGDGRADILLGSVTASPRDREHAGEAYLIYGVGD